MSNNETIRAAQKQVRKWIEDHGVRYFDQLTNMAMLTEEVGEVARIMARRYGEQSEKPSDKEKDLGKELSDVLFVLLCLADQCDIDLQAAFESRLVEKAERDHARHRSNRKLR
jgi:NTP pyrophosphatase (non-canonical NTP hydrolase)